MFKTNLVRVLAIGLCLISLAKARDSAWAYRGEMVFKEKDFAEAYQLLTKASSKLERNDPNLLYLLGQSAWQVWLLDKKEKDWIGKAKSHFSELTKRFPYYGRGWLYLGLAEVAIEERSSDGVNSQEWKDSIKPLFENAIRKEPGSAWVAYTTGKHYLLYRKFLSDKETRLALARIKKSTDLHYPDQASPNLQPALSFLWNQFSDFDLLKEVTPKDEPSYAVLNQFIEENNLWAYRDQVYPDFVRINEAAYMNQCERAEKFLKKKNYKRAFAEFQKAFWLNRIFLRAKLGMLVAQERLNQLPADYEVTLKEIVEEGEEITTKQIDLIGPVIERSSNAYFKGLYAFRKNDLNTARDWLEQVPLDEENRFLPRFLAAAYWRLGEKEKAIKLLRLVINQKEPDLRDLHLFKEWNSPYQKAVLRKIGEVVTIHRPAEDWWGWAGNIKGIRHKLDSRARMGLIINLKPGVARLNLTLRSAPDETGTYGYLLIRLWDGEKERRIGSAYLNHKDWTRVIWPVNTTGGKRWLEAELLNGRESSTSETGPVVEFGSLMVDYPR